MIPENDARAWAEVERMGTPASVLHEALEAVQKGGVSDGLAYAYHAGRVARWDGLVVSAASTQDAVHRALREFYHDEPFMEGHEYTHPDDCPDCPTAAALAADAASAVIAELIRRELVCCDIYDQLADLRDARQSGRAWPGTQSFREALRERGHQICYWGELAARIAENRTPAMPPPGEPGGRSTSALSQWCGGLDGEHTIRGCSCDSPSSDSPNVETIQLNKGHIGPAAPLEPWVSEAAREMPQYIPAPLTREEMDQVVLNPEEVTGDAYAAGQWDAEQLGAFLDLLAWESFPPGPHDHKEPFLGTRGFFGFVADGREFITYNHFDSYPSGLGADILDWLLETPKDDWVPDATLKGDPTEVHDALTRPYAQTLREAVLALQLVTEDVPPTDAQRAALGDTYADFRVNNGEGWYALLRQTQGDLSAILASGYMIDGSEFPMDGLYAEWGYLIDLDRNVFEVYCGGQCEPHSSGRFAGRESRKYAVGEFYPAKLVHSWSMTDLPNGSHDFLVQMGYATPDED